MSNCTLEAMSNSSQNLHQSIKDNSLDENLLTKFLSNKETSEEFKNFVIDSLKASSKASNIFKKKLTGVINSKGTQTLDNAIEDYVTGIYSKLGAINPNSETVTANETKRFSKRRISKWHR